MKKTTIIKLLYIFLISAFMSACSESDTNYVVVDNIIESVDTNSSWAEYEVKDSVTIPDDGLKKAIQLSLGMSANVNNEITTSDMQALTTLYGANMNIVDLSGIEYATSLQKVYLQNNHITNVEPLGQLRELREINIDNNRPVINRLRSITPQKIDLTPLATLGNLDKFSASDCELGDDDMQQIAALNARHINVSNNQITTMPLDTLVNGGVESIVANNNMIDKIEGSSQGHLTAIELSGNNLSNIDNLLNIQSLETINVEGNQIQSPIGFTQIKQLKEVRINGNGIHPNDVQITAKNTTSLDTIKYVGREAIDCDDDKNDLFSLLTPSTQKCLNYGKLIDKSGNLIVLSEFTQKSLCQIREIHCPYEISNNDRHYFPRNFLFNTKAVEILNIEIVGNRSLLANTKESYKALAHYNNGDVEDISAFVEWNSTAGQIDNQPYVYSNINLGYEGDTAIEHPETMINNSRGTLTLNNESVSEITIACKTNFDDLSTQLHATLNASVKSMSLENELRITANRAVVYVGHELRLDAWMVEKDGNGNDTNWTKISNLVTWSVNGFGEIDNSIATITGSDNHYDYLKRAHGILKSNTKGLIKVEVSLGDKRAYKWIEAIEVPELESAYNFSFDLYSNIGSNNRCLKAETLDATTNSCHVDANSSELFIAGANQSVGGEKPIESNADINGTLIGSDLSKNQIEYITDEEATKVFDEIRTHLCTINQTMYYHDAAIQAGTFRSLIDLNQCKKNGDFNNSVPFTVSVTPDKYTGSYPLNIEFWGYTQNSSKEMERITAKMHVWEQPSESNVFGIFDMDMQIRRNDTTIPFYFESYYDNDMKPTITYVAPDKRARLIFSNDGEQAYGKVAYSNPIENIYYKDGTSAVDKEEVSYDIAFNKHYLIRKAFDSNEIEAFNLDEWDTIAHTYNLYYAKNGKVAGKNNIEIQAVKKSDPNYKIEFLINDGIVESRTLGELEEFITHLEDFDFYEIGTNRPLQLYLNPGILTQDTFTEGTLDELKYDFVPGRYFDNTKNGSSDRFLHWIDDGFKLARQIDDISYEILDDSNLNMDKLKEFAASNIYGAWEVYAISYTLLGALVHYSDFNAETPSTDDYANTYSSERYLVITNDMSSKDDKIYTIDWSQYSDSMDQNQCEALNNSVLLAADSDGYKWDNGACVPKTPITLSTNKEEYLTQSNCEDANKTWNSLKNVCNVCESNYIGTIIDQNSSSLGSTYAQYVYDQSINALRELKQNGDYGRCITRPNRGFSEQESPDWVSLIGENNESYSYWYDPYCAGTTYIEVIYTDNYENAGMADDTTFLYGDNSDVISILGSNSQALGIPMQITKKSTGEIVTDESSAGDYSDLKYTQAYQIPNAKMVTSQYNINYIVMHAKVLRKPLKLSTIPQNITLQKDTVTLPSFDAWIGEEPEDGLENPLFENGRMTNSIDNVELFSVRGKLFKESEQNLIYRDYLKSHGNKFTKLKGI